VSRVPEFGNFSAKKNNCNNHFCLFPAILLFNIQYFLSDFIALSIKLFEECVLSALIFNPNSESISAKYLVISSAKMESLVNIL
jgi:hypothetical protein